MQTILDVLSLSTKYLSEKGIANARRQSEDLLCDALGIDRLKLYLEFERPLTEVELTACRERLSRRAKGEPLPYIHGEVQFYDCILAVSPAVLIPRQETEILVDKIVHFLKKQDLQGKVLWDMCCGSGCIGIAIKKHLPDLTVVLADISPAALAVARQNALRNQVDVQCVESALLNAFVDQKAHYFVCNPPYISEQDYTNLDKEVKNYEPRLALVGGVRGTELYEELANILFNYLHPSAAVWFEIGYQQGESVKALFSGPKWKNQQVEKDWSGHDRFFFLENE